MRWRAPASDVGPHPSEVVIAVRELNDGRVVAGVAGVARVAPAPAQRHDRHVEVEQQPALFGIRPTMVLKGGMDIAVLYGERPVTGLDYRPLMREHFYLVAPRSMYTKEVPSEEVSPAEVAQFDLLLPYRESFLRQTVERVCAEVGLRPRIVAEIASQSTLSSAIAAGMGAAVLPLSIAKALPNLDELSIRRINAPSASQQMSLCIPDNVALSDAAFAVYKILLEIIAKEWGPFDWSSGSVAGVQSVPTSPLGGSEDEP